MKSYILKSCIFIKLLVAHILIFTQKTMIILLFNDLTLITKSDYCDNQTFNQAHKIHNI